MSFHRPYTLTEPKAVTDYGSSGVTIRVFIDPATAPNFVMRRFDMAPGGKIGIHSHPHEHEMYILEGELFLIDSKGKHEKISKGEFVFMPGGEEHGYVNEGPEPCAFICMVPK